MMDIVPLVIQSVKRHPNQQTGTNGHMILELNLLGKQIHLIRVILMICILFMLFALRK